MRKSFAPVAGNYAASAFHAGRETLEEVLTLSLPQPRDSVLDIATGTGHTALALAPHVARVVGLDLTPEMLAEARRAAAAGGAGNVEWVQGDAVALPFRAGTFDLCTSRAAPHHFSDLRRAVNEVVRVLKPGGRACLIDCSPPPDARDRLHPVEIARDPSHVRSRTLEEWQALLTAAGLTVEVAERRYRDWDFEGWMATMAVPPSRQVELAAVIESVTGAAREQLRPHRRAGRLWHAYWHALIRARKPLQGGR